MSILATLFAARGSWLAVLVLIVVCGLVGWFAVRVVVDTVTWFREEIVGDFQASRRKKSKPAPPGKDSEGD